VNSSVCTRIVLRVGDEDAKKLADSFVSFDAKTLKNLENYQAIARIERPEGDFNLALREPDWSDGSEERRDEVIAHSRAKYAKPRAEVEAAWLAKLNLKFAEAKATTPPPTVEPAPPASPVRPPKSAVSEVLPVSEIPQADGRPQGLPQATEIPHPTEALKAEADHPLNIAIEPRMAGRGKLIHKNIQKQLELEAKKLGFWADIEKQLDVGVKNSKVADMVLRQGDILIAVECALTENLNHEFENVEKCLVAGFQRVAVIAIDEKFLNKLAAAICSGMAANEVAKVSFYLTPELFLQELKVLAATIPPPPDATGKTIRVNGIEVTVNFPTDHEKQAANYELMKRKKRP
jgi:hypothetical protein